MYITPKMRSVATSKGFKPEKNKPVLLSELQEWLREDKGIHIWVTPNVMNLREGSTINYVLHMFKEEYSISKTIFKNYDEALLNGLEECL